jgi:superfamily II DNA or RNA helicase
MNQPDLFSTVEMFDLPPLEYWPIRSPAGQIRCVLRPAETVSGTPLGEVSVSPRLKEPVYQLSSGEKLIVTARKLTQRPVGVDGVLSRDPGEKLKWQSHQLVDQLEQDAKSRGWRSVIRDRSCQWDGKFSFDSKNADVADGAEKRALRPPQIGALHAIGAHWSLYRQPATLVMPTGTGKTETMLSVLATYVREPLLVVVPSDTLRSQTAGKFLTFGLLRWLGSLTSDAPNPIVGIITKVPKTVEALEIFERCNVVIGTMDSLADSAAEPLWPEISKRVGALIIDEAHHIGAARWSHFREAFSDKRILQFTATPFRRDGNLVDGQVIFNYPLRMAQADEYFKPISFEPVYEANPKASDSAVADLAVARLREDLARGYNHIMMARCASITRAEAIHEVYQTIASDLNPLLIHSGQHDRTERVELLKSGGSRIAVCVNMLGEGFDLPELKIAAIHDLHKSLAILLQFTGRFTRTSANNIGNATIVANIAEPNVSAALERLYSEDADWNELLSEMSSEAAKDHAQLIAFLNEAKRLDNQKDDDDVPISHKLLRPTLSALVYEAEKFLPKKFHEGLPIGLHPYRVWLHEPSGTLFFVTRSEPSVKWSRSKAVRDREWALFVLHHDSKRKLLYLSSTDHDSNFEPLAKALGASRLLTGDVIFRSMGRLNRLVFQNVGVKKHGRRNLSYASYTGAEVVSALGLAEKSGSMKAVLSGLGWEGGRQVTVGCSIKGRIWSREQGSIPRFNEWCENVGDKLLDEKIDTTKLIDNVLLPTIVDTLPNIDLLSIEWPVEILRQSEERVVFSDGGNEVTQTTFDLSAIGTEHASNAIDFELIEASSGSWGTFRFELAGAQGFKVTQTSGKTIAVTIGKIHQKLDEYFSNYPPLFRFVDLSELDANLHVVPQTPFDLSISEDRFSAWAWDGVDIKKESMWKDGYNREDSIQWHVAKNYIDAGFDVVFDDDASGEAADLVCLKIEDEHIRMALVHCKFSGGKNSGERVKDVVEVSSQAVRSARWAGRFAQLCQHLRTRNEALKVGGRSSRFLKGSPSDLSKLSKLNRFRPLRTEILIVQPGLSKSGRTDAQSAVLGAALNYIKQTIDVDLDIICSE